MTVASRDSVAERAPAASVRDQTATPVPAHLVIARLKNGREVTYPLPGKPPFLMFAFPGVPRHTVLCLWCAAGYVGEQVGMSWDPAAGPCAECAIAGAESAAEQQRSAA